MFNDMTLVEALKMFWPLLAFNLILAAAAVIDIVRREKVKYLPKAAWIPIVMLVQLFGAVIYFIIGRDESYE